MRPLPSSLVPTLWCRMVALAGTVAICLAVQGLGQAVAGWLEPACCCGVEAHQASSEGVLEVPACPCPVAVCLPDQPASEGEAPPRAVGFDDASSVDAAEQGPLLQPAFIEPPAVRPRPPARAAAPPQLLLLSTVVLLS